MKRRTIIVIASIAVAALAIGGGVAYSAATSMPTVATAQVTTETLKIAVSASGKVESARRAGVYPPTSGRLGDVTVADGQSVKAGQRLASMDTAPLNAAVGQAEANLAAARAQVDAVERGVPSAIERNAANTMVGAARSAYNAAVRAYNTYVSKNHGSDSVTRTTRAQLAAAREQAYAALQAAKANLAKLSSAGRVAAARRAAQAAVNAAETALSQARSLLSRADLVAPIDGVVEFNPLGPAGSDGTYPKAERGAGVSPASPVFSVTDLTKINFNAQVDETDIASVKTGQPATITLDAYPDKSFNGSVMTVRTAAITTSTGGVAFPVITTLYANGARIYAGMSGSAQMVVKTVPEALVVPVEAVRNDGGQQIVFVIRDGKAARTVVTLGDSTDTKSQVIAGLSAGQVVATSQVAALADGQSVKTQG